MNWSRLLIPFVASTVITLTAYWYAGAIGAPHWAAWMFACVTWFYSFDSFAKASQR